MEKSEISNFPIKYYFFVTFLLAICACSSDSDPDPILPSEIQGTVIDELGGDYDNVKVILTKANSQIASTSTNPMGEFSFEGLNDGQYEVEITPPLATSVQDNNPISITASDGNAPSVAFTLSSTPVSGSVIGAGIDPFGEINNVNGEAPTDPGEKLYAVNVFTDGQLNPILAPDGHHIIYSEWQQAQGEALVSCSGKTTNFDIHFTGLIPNGVYTVWVIPLGADKSSWNTDDILGTGALGDPTGNQNTIIATAQGEGGLIESMTSGDLSTFGALTTCVLTSDKGMVLILDYHIDGKTYGATSGPDHTEVGHVIFVF